MFPKIPCFTWCECGGNTNIWEDFIHLPKANWRPTMLEEDLHSLLCLPLFFCFRNVCANLMMNIPPAVYILLPSPMAVFNPAVFYHSDLLLLIGPCDALWLKTEGWIGQGNRDWKRGLVRANMTGGLPLHLLSSQIPYVAPLTLANPTVSHCLHSTSHMAVFPSAEQTLNWSSLTWFNP